MAKIDYRTRTDYEEKLKILLCFKSQLIFTDSVFVTYGSEYIEARNLFFYLSEYESLHVSSIWSECAESLVDFHSFFIEQKGELNEAEKGSIISFYDQGNIESIVFYSKTEKVDEFEVEYDFGIKIKRSDGKVILISAGDLAFRNVRLYFGNEIVNRVLNENLLKERLLVGGK